MRKLELATKMQELYESLDYFVSIDADGPISYEENYHKTTVDPDGNIRNLLSERDRSLECISEITGYLKQQKPGKILDFGCGLGWLLSSLGDAWEKHGVEISRFASNHASQFGKIHNGTIDIYNETGFDFIVMNHIIEHLSDPVSALKIVKEKLKNNGVLIVGTPDFDSGAARRFGHKFRLLHDPTHISLFSSDSMHRFLRNHGFKILKVEYPYFDTPWFSKENLLKILNSENISPPFYGSYMTFFAKKIS